MKRNKRPRPNVPLPVVAMSANAQTGLDAFAVWHEVCRPAFEITRLQPNQPFAAGFQFYNVNGLVFNRTSYGATRYHRTWQHIGLGDADHLALQLLLRGQEEVSVKEGTTGLMAPDRIVLRDWAHPFTSESTAAEQISVMIPRHLVAASDLTYEQYPILSWSLDSVPGQMLGHSMTQIWESLPHVESADTPAIASAFLGLLNGLLAHELGGNHQAGSAKPVTVQAMKTYLLRHLPDPGLGVERLVEVFGCSRATIYRLFRDSGGVVAFIRDQRLDAALEQLTHPGGQPCSIRDVAKNLGFQDNVYFHRAFKKRFGLTPREAQESAEDPSIFLPHEDHVDRFSPNISTFHNWANMTPHLSSN